jgi:hypothetical protein
MASAALHVYISPMLFFELLIVVALILLNGVLAMAELAVVSSRRARLQALVNREVVGARRALALASDPGRFLSTVQIGITLNGVLSGAFSGATLGQRLVQWFVAVGLSPAIAEIVGVGLCDEKAVRITVEEGPKRVLELLKWGANFDKQPGNPHDLAFGLEGGHSFARILHAYGDATGKELAQTLIRRVREKDSIRISENSFAVDLITDPSTSLGAGEQCVGALAMIEGNLTVIWAHRTILASGGAGQLYRESTNPKIATADGHAMAYRAGATLKDMEMVQFHPTTLYVAGSSRALITEAVRGEGAHLVDRNGYRFMTDYHKDGELAPRDVVSRAIVEHGPAAQRRRNGAIVFEHAREVGPRRELSLDRPHERVEAPQAVRLVRVADPGRIETPPADEKVDTSRAASAIAS